jgi:hypothetical protein
MPKPMAICIEELDSSEAKYIRCVALPGRQPGLRLDKTAQVLWQSDDGVSCELWVSADERLILYRPEGADSVVLDRAGRTLDVPYGKPVVVIDQDQVSVGGRRVRIHFHCEAPSVAAPSPLPSRSQPLGRLARTLAATAILGATVASGCAEQPIEVRQVPPTAPPPPPTPTIEVRLSPPTATAPPVLSPTPGVSKTTVLQAIQGAWTASQVYLVDGERTWVTGTLTIASNSYTFKPARQVKGPSVAGKLDFLFDAPQGQVAIAYSGKVKPEDTIESFAPGDTLATCELRAKSGVVGKFLIKVQDSKSLYLQSDKGELWSVKKQLGAANKP